MSTTYPPLGNRPLTVVLVGAGQVSRYHLAGWRAVPGVTVAAIGDRVKARAEERARTFGVPRVYDVYEAMLDETRPDVVDVCTPPEVHLDQVAAAAARGIHVICQKPLAPSIAEAGAIVRSAEAAGVRLMVHENFRFRIWYRELKRCLDAGMIGRPYYFRSDARMAGTVPTHAHPDRPWSLVRQPFFSDMQRLIMYESMIHQLDVCRYLFGEARSIYAQARRVSPLVRGEDLASALVTFDGLHAVVERSYASRGYAPPPLVSEWGVVEGDRGAVFLEADGRLRIEQDEPGGRATVRRDYATEDAYQRSYTDTISHFVTHLRAGTEFETSGRDNLRTLRLALAAYESWERNQVVHL